MRIVPNAQRILVSTGIAIALATNLTACTPTNLYVASNTIVGVNGAMNADQTSGHLIVGYDRRFAAIVPKSAPILDDEGKVATDVEPDAHEAMSVLSCSELQVDGIFLTGFTEYLATGEAARRFAEKVASEPTLANNAAMGKIFDCYIPKERKTASSGEPAAGEN